MTYLQSRSTRVTREVDEAQIQCGRRRGTDPARKPTDPERKPMDPVRSTTDPARTKRDQGLGLGLGIEQGLGLGIVPVSASGGSRGHWRARRREEVGGERGERVADAATPTRQERRARRERSGRDCAVRESRERGGCGMLGAPPYILAGSCLADE